MEIYQEIWEADQASAGMQPILETQTGDEERAYVKVSTPLAFGSKGLCVLTNTNIPKRKSLTYDLCRRQFDNYALPEDAEVETSEEGEEAHDQVRAAIDTPPLRVPRDCVTHQSRTSITRERCYKTITEIWFSRFSMGGDQSFPDSDMSESAHNKVRKNGVITLGMNIL